MVGTGMTGLDAEGVQLLLGAAGQTVASLTGDDETVVSEKGGRVAIVLGRIVQHPDDVGSSHGDLEFVLRGLTIAFVSYGYGRLVLAWRCIGVPTMDGEFPVSSGQRCRRARTITPIDGPEKIGGDVGRVGVGHPGKGCVYGHIDAGRYFRADDMEFCRLGIGAH